MTQTCKCVKSKKYITNTYNKDTHDNCTHAHTHDIDKSNFENITQKHIHDMISYAYMYKHT